MDDLKVTHTTYNIPIETSIEYERKKRDYDQDLLDDSGKVRGSVSQASVKAKETHLNQMMGSKITEWGRYRVPDGFEEQSDKLFGPHLTPSCTTERLDAASARIEGKRDEIAGRAPPGPSGPAAPPTSDAEISGVEKDANKIQSLLGVIKMINQGLEYSYGERARFQKG